MPMSGGVGGGGGGGGGGGLDWEMPAVLGGVSPEGPLVVGLGKVNCGGWQSSSSSEHLCDL